MDIDLKFFLDLLRIPSLTGDVAQCNRAVGALRRWLEGRGLHCETPVMAGGREALYASVVEGDRTPRFLMNAHLDVVPPSEPGQFEPRIEADRVLARGAHDCKGPVMAIASALASLAGSGTSAGALFTSDEETGGESAAEAFARGFRATGLAAVVDSDDMAIGHAQKGIAVLRLVARGRGGHAAMPWEWGWDNPIDKLCDGWRRVRDAWPELPEDKWGDTVQATVVRAGSTDNQVPPTAEMTLNVRYVRPGSEAGIAALIGEKSGCEVEFLRVFPPLFCDPGAPALVALRNAMQKAFGREIPLRRLDGATDARHFSAPGAAPVAILGVEGGNCHASGEWVSLSSLARNAEFFAAFARDFG